MQGDRPTAPEILKDVHGMGHPDSIEQLREENVRLRRQIELLQSDVGGMRDGGRDALSRINQIVHSTHDFDEIIRCLMAEGCDALASESAAISLREQGKWTLIHTHRMPSEVLGQQMTDKEEQHALLALTSREPVTVPDAFHDERFDRDHLRRHHIRSVMVLPLILRNQPFGVIFFNYHTSQHQFTESEIHFARQLAATASIALQNARLFEECQQVEASLREGELRMRLATQSTGVGIWEWNVTTNSIRWDAQMFNIYGIAPTPEGMVDYDTWRQAVFPEDLASQATQLQETVQHRAQNRRRFRIIRRSDRECRLIQAVDTVRLNEVGQVEWVVGTNLDVTDRQRAEQALQASEHFLKRVLEVSPGVIHVFDLVEQQNVFINQRVAATLGYSAEEIQALGSDVLSQLMHPDDLVRFVPYLKELETLPDNEATEFEYRMRNRAGEWCWWQSRDAVFKRNEAGAVTQLVGTAIEITSRKEAEEAFFHAHQNLQTVLNSITDGLLMLDPEWRCTYFNDQGVAMVGMPADQLIGRCLWDLFPHAKESEFFEGYHRAVRTGQPQHFEEFYPEPLNMWFECHCYPTDKGLSVYFRNITERKKAETAVRASAEMFRHLVEHSPFGVYAVDADFRLVQVSAGAQKVFENVRPLLGRDFAEVLRIIWPEPFAAEVIQHFRHTLETGETYHSPSTVEQRHDSGEVESYDWRVDRVMLPDGRYGVVCHFYDLSERRRYEEALRAADRRKDEFLAMLAHELRNPLAPLRNGLELIRLTGGDKATLENVRDMMDRQVLQLVRLVDDLMDVSRITRGKVELHRENLPLPAVIQSAIETSRPLIDEMQHELTVTLPEEPVIIHADFTRLVQVFLNLLNNAAKYSNPGGRIWLTASRHDDEVSISVRDAGIGIASDHLAQIFEMFSQLDHSLGRAHGGLGIGLTVVQRLVDMHGGSIVARSEGAGLGSEFIVRLPVVAETARPQSSIEADGRPTRRTGFRLLVVDDNLDAANSLAKMLQFQGNEVLVAYDGEEAVRQSEEFSPEIILLDIGLPKRSGYEVCREIRQQLHAKPPIIIALTGWGQHEDRVRTQAAGFNHHLVKPVEPKLLFDLLIELAATRLE